MHQCLLYYLTLIWHPSTHHICDIGGRIVESGLYAGIAWCGKFGGVGSALPFCTTHAVALLCRSVTHTSDHVTFHCVYIRIHGNWSKVNKIQRPNGQFRGRWDGQRMPCRAKQLSGYKNYCPRIVKNRMCADHRRNIGSHSNFLATINPLLTPLIHRLPKGRENLQQL